MDRFTFQFGHLTAGRHKYECGSDELPETVQRLVDELYESDSGHYQVYFVNSAGAGLTIGQSGLLTYTPSLAGNESLYYFPDSRDTVYEIAVDFLAGNIGWWVSRFNSSFPPDAPRPDLFARDQRGTVDYPLHKAALDGDLVEVKGLIKAGHPVNGLDNKRRTPLVLAAAMGHLDVCKYLVSHGADVRARDDWGNSVSTLADEFPDLVVYFNSLKTR